MSKSKHFPLADEMREELRVFCVCLLLTVQLKVVVGHCSCSFCDRFVADCLLLSTGAISAHIKQIYNYTNKCTFLCNSNAGRQQLVQ